MKKIFNLLAFGCLLFVDVGFADAADRTDARVGVIANTRAAATATTTRTPTVSINTNPSSSTQPATLVNAAVPEEIKPATLIAAPASAPAPVALSQGECRTAYRDCMDQFCMLPEENGGRCACSEEIFKTASLVASIQKIQQEAEKKYTVDVEKAQLGGDTLKAKSVFQEDTPKGRKRYDIFAAEDGEEEDDEDVGGDSLGLALYDTASANCQVHLDACGAGAALEKTLYETDIKNKDCPAYKTFLADQKRDAEANKLAAEKAVRTARVGTFDTFNKYNRGQCLLAYRACISFTGGCGANFENCFDSALLDRRAHACDDVLDQCVASRPDVEKDWLAEKTKILADAEKFIALNKPKICKAKVDECLEDVCSKATSSSCLTNIEVAKEQCPIINDCYTDSSSSISALQDRLRSLAVDFCKNDVTACFKEKCGKDLNAEFCLGKSATDIKKLCVQKDLPACNNYPAANYSSFQDFVMWQIRDAQEAMCINYVEEYMGRSACGTEMDCIPVDPTISSMTDKPKDEAAFKTAFTNYANAQVDNLFANMSKDSTKVGACDPAKNDGKGTIFGEAKSLGKIAAVKRMYREYDRKLDEVSRTKSAAEAAENCKARFATAKEENSKYTKASALADKKEGQWITDYLWEPDLRNCQFTRYNIVCEEGGEDENTARMKAMGGGIAGGAGAGMSAGSMFGPWGTAIGTVAGGALGAIGGIMASKGIKKEMFCHEIGPIYEDRNM